MSLALEFLSAGGKAPAFEQIEAWRRDIENFSDPTEKDGVRIWQYRNADTGVYFAISLYDVQPGNGDAPSPCGLDATINHLRPSFFAWEAAPLLSSLAQHLGLVLSEGDSRKPLNAPAGSEALNQEIISLWRDGNQAAIEQASEQGKKLHFIDSDTSRRWWEYMNHRRELSDHLAEKKIAAVIPPIYFLMAPGTGRVVTVMSWENERACVFPSCDYVVIDRTIETKKFFRRITERQVAYLSTEALMRQIVAALTTVEVNGINYRLLSAENAWRAAERIPSLALEEDVSHFKPLRPEQIVDQPL